MQKITEVIWGSSFLKEFKKMCKKDPGFKNKFMIFFHEFSSNPVNKKYKLHKLKGKLKGYFSVKIEYDLRLIFAIKSENQVILIDIGKHDKVY